MTQKTEMLDKYFYENNLLTKAFIPQKLVLKN